MDYKESTPQEVLENELESGLNEARHDSFMKFSEQIREFKFFESFPVFVTGLMEKNYDDAGLSESKAYDTPLKDLTDDKQGSRYSEKRLELTQREFLRIMYQAAADVGYTREWLQEMYEKANRELSPDEHGQYREALKKVYLVLRLQGFSHNDIVA